MTEKEKNKKNKLRELRKAIEKDGTKLDDFYEELLKNLEEGRDYGAIEFTSKKGKKFKTNTFLFKAGAERILCLLDQEAKQPEPMILNNDMFIFRTNIYKREGSPHQLLGIGFGGGDPALGINIELKKGKKRSLVDGVISSNYLSGIFVQDEDLADKDEYESIKNYAMKIAEETGNPDILKEIDKGIKAGVEPKRMQKWLKQIKTAQEEKENG